MLVNIIQEGPEYWAELVEHSTLDHGVNKFKVHAECRV